MTDLEDKQCLPCEGGVDPLSAEKADTLVAQIPGWKTNDNRTALRREYQFKNFYRTMSFVNAVAHIANTENHHPDLEVGYNYCRILFTTHAIGGLSENDFICAAKINRIAQI